MSDPRLWEIVAGSRIVAHTCWVGESELYADAPWPLPRQLEAWFSDRVGFLDAVDAAEVDRFFAVELPRRMSVHAQAISVNQLPKHAAWLGCVEADKVPGLGVRDPFGWRSNRWAPEFDLDWLLTETARGTVRWSRGAVAGFKAGGRCPDASEMWLNLHANSMGYTLVIRRRRRLWGRPVRQTGGWFRRTTLQRLNGLLEGRL